MWTTAEILRAFRVAGDPTVGGVTRRQALDIIAWAEKHLSDFEQQQILNELHEDYDS